MALKNPYEGATYRIVEQNDATYGVEVKVPDAFPALITTFATVGDAEAWILKHKRLAESGVGASRGRWAWKS